MKEEYKTIIYIFMFFTIIIRSDIPCSKTVIVMDLTGNFSYLLTDYGVSWFDDSYYIKGYELHVPKGTIVKSFNLDGV